VKTGTLPKRNTKTQSAAAKQQQKTPQQLNTYKLQQQLLQTAAKTPHTNHIQLQQAATTDICSSTKLQ